ncbi:hypothetical protein PYCC9005_000391 [Savitreella phatthalungensis]
MSHVRSTCHALIAAGDSPVSISDDAVDRFLAELDEESYLAVVAHEKSASDFPLQFSSREAKLNFYAVLHLLNFGSGYRTVLKAANGKGAFDNMIHLLMSLHISGIAMTAEWMTSVDAHLIAEFVGVSMVNERPHPDLPAVMEVVPSPVSELMQKIAGALNSTGVFLADRGHETLFAYVEASCAASGDIDDLLKRLAQVPALDDRHTNIIGKHEVWLMKKAQIMIGELVRQGLVISWLTDGDLTVYSDNVLPTMLRRAGVLQTSEAIENARAEDEPLSIELATCLRAASVVACELILKRGLLQGKTWLGDEINLDHYLWKLAKQPQFRSFERYRVPGTIMF